MVQSLQVAIYFALCKVAGVKGRERKVVIAKAGSQESQISLCAAGKCLHLLHEAKAQLLLPWQSHALDGHRQPHGSFHSLQKLRMVLSQSTWGGTRENIVF